LVTLNEVNVALDAGSVFSEHLIDVVSHSSSGGWIWVLSVPAALGALVRGRHRTETGKSRCLRRGATQL
jgi:hypothetical protein